MIKNVRSFYLASAEKKLRRSMNVRGTHPALELTHVRCSACGNEFTTRSARDALTVEVCSNCHPAYTGVERPVAQGSRVERFERRRARAVTA
jgi:large subunit ribosomal protein L31